MIKALILDFDGVIHNTLEICFKIYNKINHSSTLEDYRKIFLGNIYDNNFVMNNVNEFYKLQKKEYENLKIEEKNKKHLIRLNDSFRIFIITSNKESVIKNYLKKNKISNLFEGVLGFETHTSKIEKFNLLFRKYNLDKNECLFVTDTLGDIIEANNVGLKTIAVLGGYHDKETLEKGNPYKIINNLDALPIFFKI